MKKKHQCDACHGTGKWLCGTCSGTGKLPDPNKPGKTIKCPNCDRKGYVHCEVCGGSGYVRDESGSSNGQTGFVMETTDTANS